MATDGKEIAGRLRTEAGYRHGRDGEDTVSNMPDCRPTGGVPTAFGMEGMGVYADMPVHKLSDKPADLIDSQGC